MGQRCGEQEVLPSYHTIHTIPGQLFVATSRAGNSTVPCDTVDLIYNKTKKRKK